MQLMWFWFSDANLENDGAKVKYDDPTKKEQGGWQHYVDLESGGNFS